MRPLQVEQQDALERLQRAAEATYRACSRRGAIHVTNPAAALRVARHAKALHNAIGQLIDESDVIRRARGAEEAEGAK